MGEDWWSLKYLQALKSYESTAPMSQTLGGILEIGFYRLWCVLLHFLSGYNTPSPPPSTPIEGKFDFQQLKIIKGWA